MNTADIKTLVEARNHAALKLAESEQVLANAREELKNALAIASGKATNGNKPKKATAARGSVEKAVREAHAKGMSGIEDIAEAYGLNVASVRSAVRKILNTGVTVTAPRPPAPVPAGDDVVGEP